jgi:two-component system, OmpR family, sensor histidine kinase BaeS
VFVLIINATVMVLSRMVSMIVKPVDQLVEASRRLAEEDFEHRVDLKRSDEFAELARAHNAAAEQLQQNEERKVETLHQVARTLSHELNNAIAIIELQLTHLARKNKGDGEQAERLKEIHRTLERISRTVDALAHVRRIVLTDYTSGVSMLDLERSVEEEPAAAGRVAR